MVKIALFSTSQKSYFLTLQSSNQSYNIIEKSRNTKNSQFFQFFTFLKIFFQIVHEIMIIQA